MVVLPSSLLSKYWLMACIASLEAKPSKEPELPHPKSTGGRLHVGRWPVCAAIYPHVLRAHQLWSTISDPSEGTKLLFAKLLTEAAW